MDLRFAVRRMLRKPGFSLAAVTTVAVGIGATTVIFSLADSLLIRPLQLEDRDSLLTFEETRDGEPVNSVFTYPGIREYRERASEVATIAAYGGETVALRWNDSAEPLFAGYVTRGYFDVVGVAPALGRFFGPEEMTAGSPTAVAVLSHRLWRERFGGDRSVLGRSIRLNSRSVTVIGVAPEGFRGTDLGFAPEIWLPVPMYAGLNPGADIEDPSAFSWLVPVARLHPETSVERVRSVLSAVGRDLRARPGGQEEIAGVRALPVTGLPPRYQRPVRLFLTFLFAAAALVLLIACVNVGGMLLAHATGRRREIGVRMALGASRGRLLTQLLTESALLFLFGGAAGFALAHWGMELTMAAQHRILPVLLPGARLDLRVDWLTAAFSLLTALGTGVAFGLVPALRASRREPRSSLTSVRRGGFGHPTRLRSVLVVAQVAASVVLLVVAGLLGRSLQRAVAIDPGIDSEDVVVAGLRLAPHGYDRASGRVLLERLRQRLEANPDVSRASFSRFPTLGGMVARQVVRIPGAETPDGRPEPLIDFNVVDDGYFETLGIPILEGRGFTATDREGSPAVAVVNETMARRFWPDRSAVGARFGVGAEDVEIVGVARDAKYRSLDEAPLPFLYRPLAQSGGLRVTLHVRSAGAGTGEIAALARRELRALDPNLPLFDPGSLASRIMIAGFLPQQVGGVLVGVFGIAGLLLTSVGLYGVLAYHVARRTHEIGVRVAMGARTGEVIGRVVADGARHLAVGLVLGLGVSFAVSRLLSSLLVEIGPADPPTFAGVSLLLAAVTLIATYLPARRAVMVDPTVALRSE